MPAKKQFGEYYLGLNMGTDAVGWAVTSPDYQVLKFQGKAMWGVRQFPEAQTAVDRRIFRIARRRIARRHQRIALLQDLFRAEIEKVDPLFFIRMQDSMLHQEDKRTCDANSLFASKGFTDRDYHRAYPTIYHLRSELVHSVAPHDVRLVYLALHHILKFRGHFLFEGSIEKGNSFEAIIRDMEVCIRDTFEEDIACDDLAAAADVICDQDASRATKQRTLMQLFGCPKKSASEQILKLMCGGKVKLKDIFPGCAEDADLEEISFTDAHYDDNWPKVEAALGDDAFVIAKAKAIHDWALLENTLHGHAYFSDAKVDIYNRHAADLKLLKQVIRRYAPELAKDILRNPHVKGNYCAYAGIAKVNGHKAVVDKRCSQEEFCKFLKSKLKGIPTDEPEVADMMTRIENGTFMPKLRTKDNRVVPHQLHQKELEMILSNAARYLPFLSEKDEDGLTVSDKIRQILTFRIPYYVGPLGGKVDDHHWVEKRSNEKIYPWNFDKIVDRELSAERFITRLTAQCAYLKDCKVLPEASLLHSKYRVLDELNALTISGKPITVELKQAIFNGYFLKRIRPTIGGMITFLKTKGIRVKKEDIGGIDGEFRASMKSWIEMQELLGEHFSEDIAEDIIRVSTVIGAEPQMYRRKLEKELGGRLPADIIRKASFKRYSGWGRLSAEFLTELYDGNPIPETGECCNVISALWETNETLNQLMSTSHDYARLVQQHNHAEDGEEGITYKLVRDLYVSPATKRSIWQSLLVMKEIKSITGRNPERVFINAIRTDGPRYRPTYYRKQILLNLYKKYRDDARDWTAEISAYDEADFRNDRLFLYYMQQGRCLYTGEAIDIENLQNSELYDVDHIYPRSRIKDLSLENKVLVSRKANLAKADVYPIESDVQAQMMPFWNNLLSDGFISKRKYDRLIRTEPLTINELTNAVSRQMTETHPGAKAMADILRSQMPETEIVLVKSELIADFRYQQRFVKCREVNDLYRGKDAYLAIPVGNVYYTKFGKDPRQFFKQPKPVYSLNAMFDYDIRHDGNTAWIPGADGHMAAVRNAMAKNNLQVTRMVIDQKGALFDALPVRKGKWQLPIKQNYPCLNDSSKYGGYNKIAGAYFMLVEHTEKGKRVRSLIDMPLYMKPQADDAERVKAMLEQEKGLTDPQVILPHIGINSVIEIEGFRLYLTGRGGIQLVYAPAHQLILRPENEDYMHHVMKVCTRAADYRRTHREEDDELPATEYGKVNAADNLRMYDLFTEKLGNKTYGTRMGIQARNLAKKREAFEALSVPAQCDLLRQVLNLFANSRALADLSALGLPKNAGSIATLKTMSIYDSVRIIDQSVTGFYETARDMLV